MKKNLLALFCLIISLQLIAQQGYKSSVNTSAPWTYWWWQGSAVNKTGITWQLEHFKKSGLGGAHVIPIYGVKGEEGHFLPFLGKEWLEIFNFTIAEAKRVGLGIDLSTGTGWPFGGPGVTPGTAARQIVFNEVSSLNTPKINELLRRSNAGEPVVFVVKPDGKYKLIHDPDSEIKSDKELEIKYLIITFELTNQQVKRAAPGGAGLVVDHFEKGAMSQYLNWFDSTLCAVNNKLRPRAMYNDSYEVYNANWTPRIFEAFKIHHRYDLKEVIFAVSPNFPDCPLKEQVISDYRETLSILLYEAEELWTTWVAKNGMTSRYQAHGAPGNLLDLYALSDMPETESFGSSNFTIPGVRMDADYEENRFGRPHPLMMKFASSPAHLLGKKLVASESTTWLGNHFKVALSQIKPQIDELFIAGINHVFYHGTTYSPPGEPFPGWLFYASTNYGQNSHFYNEFPLLNQYITNCQKILQESEPDNDVLVYLPIYDFWANTKEPLLSLFSVHHAGKWFLNTPFGGLSTRLWEGGYGFDFISDRQISQLKVNTDKSISVNKSRYRTVIIPETSHMTTETLKNIAALAQKGVKIIFDHQLPLGLPGYGRSAEQAQFDKLKQALNQDSSVTAGDAISALKQLNIRQESLNKSGLGFIRKQNGDLKYYFITNLSNQFYNDTISLAGAGKALEYYNPINGDRGFIGFVKQQQSIQTKLYLPPGSSCFLITYKQPQKGKNYEFKIPSEQLLMISNWKVQFTKGSPALPKTSFHPKELTSWTTWPDSVLRWFNGYGTYTSDFNLPAKWKNKKGVYLQLDDLRETAQVTVNGIPIGTIWSVPFQLYIPESRLKFGQKNTITLNVRNLSANEASYLDTIGVNWKKFYDANIVDITYQPFDASKWKPVASGLLGKVKITVVD
jgi:hypothetical protein